MSVKFPSPTLASSLIVCAAAWALAAPLHATAAGSDCEARAVSKDGKPLAGAAKTSFIKKCVAESGTASGCEARAVSKDGKPLAGAAKASFIKKCETDAAPGAPDPAAPKPVMGRDAMHTPAAVNTKPGQ
jgi:uncharacterized membrane protein